MQITIHGTERRVRFTKREVAAIRLAANLMTELAIDDDASAAGQHLCNVIGRISNDGKYTEDSDATLS